MQTSDLTLLERWRRGRDAEAFQELARRHAGMVYGACKRVLRNAHDAEEVAQDCFARLVQGDVALPKRSFGAWLHRFATHRAIDRFRTETSRNAREKAYTKNATVIENPEWNDIRKHVDEAIAALPEKLREPVVLHFLEGRTHQEIADATGTARPTVTRRISQGVERVRKSLTRKGVTLPSGTLAVLLRANAAEAASPALLGELGKMALAGGGSAAAGTAAVSAAGGLLTLKTALIAAGTVALVVATAALLNRPEPPGNVSSAQTPRVEAKAVPETAPLKPDRANSPVWKPEADGSVQVARAEDEPGNSQPRTYHHDGVFDMEKPANAVITGVVLNPDGNPAAAEPGAIPLAHIRLMGQGSYGFDAGSDGQFKIIHVPPGLEGYLWAESKGRDLISQRVAVKVPPDGLHNLQLKLGPAGKVTGRFIDRANKPVPGAGISLRAYEDAYMKNTMTDDNGRFEIRTQPGRYALTAAPRDNQGALTGPMDISVAAGQTVSGLQLKFEGIVDSIAGRVIDRNGVPQESAYVNLSNEEGSYVGVAEQTNAEGRFSFTVTRDQLYTVQVSQGGFVQSEPIPARIGDRNVQIVLTPKGKVTGRVVNAETREPITAFKVETKVAHRHGDGASTSGTGFSEIENPEGRFEGPINMAGEAQITVRAPGFQETTHTFANVSPPQEITDVVIALTSASPIKGIVIDPDGRPVRNARIFGQRVVFENHVDQNAIVAQSDHEGRFVIDSPPSDKMQITVLHDEFVPEVTELGPTARNAEEITIQLDRGATVSGKVMQGSTPLAGREVHLEMHRHQPQIRRQTTTDANGFYALKGIPQAEANIWVSGGEDSSEGIYHGVSVPSEGSVTADIILATGAASVEGTVLIAGEVPPSASISIGYEDESVQPRNYQTKTDPKGHYIHENLPPGDVHVSASVGYPRIRSIRVPVRLENGKTTRVDAHFVKADASLEGIIDLGEWKEGDVRVNLAVDTGAGVEQMHLDEINSKEGFYRFDNLPPGKATLKAHITLGQPTGYHPVYKFDLQSGMVTRQDIVIGDASIKGTVTGGTPPYISVHVYPEDMPVPEFNRITMNDIERMPHVAVVILRQETAYRLPPVEPGAYTLVALTLDDVTGIPSEDDILTSARWVAERVELKEGETLVKDLHIP